MYASWKTQADIYIYMFDLFLELSPCNGALLPQQYEPTRSNVLQAMSRLVTHEAQYMDVLQANSGHGLAVN